MQQGVVICFCLILCDCNSQTEIEGRQTRQNTSLEYKRVKQWTTMFNKTTSALCHCAVVKSVSDLFSLVASISECHPTWSASSGELHNFTSYFLIAFFGAIFLDISPNRNCYFWIFLEVFTANLPTFTNIIMQLCDLSPWRSAALDPFPWRPALRIMTWYGHQQNQKFLDLS